MRDPYFVLGVPKTADTDDIKKAYHDLAKIYHPDVSTEPEAKSKFTEINKAYETLSDEKKRHAFDQAEIDAVSESSKGFGVDISGDAGSQNSRLFAADKTTRHRRFVFLPLIVFLALATLFLLRLFAGDASRLPSALIGKEVPVFSLPPVEGLEDHPGFSDAALRRGHVTLVNVFASWCVPCHQEHSLLMQLAGDEALAASGVEVIGIAYKDEPDNIRRFLGQAGDPYKMIGADKSGRTAIDWGVYGVPETFIVKGDGTIAYKFVGPMSEDSVRTVILPQIAKAQADVKATKGSTPH
jgi:cytochrome c biogenesis protein CcmG/thiol:disulfide interchange protein DsbE